MLGTRKGHYTKLMEEKNCTEYLKNDTGNEKIHLVNRNGVKDGKGGEGCG